MRLENISFNQQGLDYKISGKEKDLAYSLTLCLAWYLASSRFNE